MKKKIVICIAALLLVVVSVLRFVWVNTSYPAPMEIAVGLGEPIISQDVEWVVHSAGFLSAEEQQKLTEELGSVADSSLYQEAQLRHYVLEVQLTNPAEGTKRVVISNGYLQTGAWQNGIDPYAYEALNENWTSSELAPGETRTIFLPYVLWDFQFTKEQWQHIEERSFELVLQLYPEKHMIQCVQG